MAPSREALRTRFWKEFGLVLGAASDIRLEVAELEPGTRRAGRSRTFTVPRRSELDIPGAGIKRIRPEVPEVDDETFEPGYVYEADVLLVSDRDALEQIRSVEPDAHEDKQRFFSRSGLILVNLPTRGGDQRSSVLDVLDRLTDKVMPGSVTPNYLMSICNVNLCPADEPALPHTEGQPFIPGHAEPPPRTDTSGAGRTVLVIDTGLVAGWDDPRGLATYPWMKPVSEGKVAGQERLAPGIATVGGDPKGQPDPVNQVIHEYVGHGTFIAGVVRCMAPRTDVWVSGALKNAGTIDELGFARILLDTLDTRYGDTWPDVICLSAGVRTLNGAALQSMTVFMNELRDNHPETVLVAAAGNHSEDESFFPAYYAKDNAFGNEDGPAVVSVGALDTTESRRAEFSNFGDWVSVFARGQSLVNAFAFGKFTPVLAPGEVFHDATHSATTETGTTETGTTETGPKTHTFDGMARWSGTSFSTPVVAGLIAARASAAGGTSRQAAAWLLEQAMKAASGHPTAPGPILHASQPMQ
jgi:hypothetical protein